MKNNDTIVAISTPLGVGGIAVVRLSGTEAFAIASRHLSRPLQSRTVIYCRFDDLDDVVATYFPQGYSGEPTVEISCHGSYYIQTTLLQVLIDSGARLAEAGEFTMRAFLSGRMDLSQAEAVADLIDAVTPAQHRLAVSQLRGSYADKLKELRIRLLDFTSLLELELDFSQEDLQFADRSQLQQLLAAIDSQLSTLISSFALGNALKKGVPVAIVGAPNAGKSSLLNALVGDDRAIVSPIPGTTRDTVEETITIDGITFRFIDTAGLRCTDDTVESLGIERSRKAIADASLVLFLHDCTSPWHEPEVDLSGKKALLVFTKCDLPHLSLPTSELAFFSSQFSISAKTGDGLDTLKKLMFEVVSGDMHENDTLLSNPRHYEALLRVRQALKCVAQSLSDGITADLVAVDLRDAIYHLGTITGDVSSDDLLTNIFSRFCIGK